MLAKAETKAGRVSAELLDQVEVSLFRTIIDLDQKIANAISSHQVNSVLHGFIGLASLYHDWYEQHPILKAESDELLAHRLALVTQYATVCRGLFELIGITPLENM